MLLIVIPLIWLAVATFVVLLCRAAADGDAALLAGGEHATAGTSHGMATPSAGTRTTWRRPAVRSATRPGRGAHRRAGLKSDLLVRRGNE